MARQNEKTCNAQALQVFEDVVPGAGLEPARLAAGDFESPESTNFTTRAGSKQSVIMAQYRA